MRAVGGLCPAVVVVGDEPLRTGTGIPLQYNKYFEYFEKNYNKLIIGIHQVKFIKQNKEIKIFP